jgi:ribonuclease-3
MQNDWPLAWLRERLAYEPRDPGLFTIALTHRSASSDNYERLEFLGDAVVNLLMSDRLYAEFPAAAEGDLSRLRARLVSEAPLAGVAGALGLGDILRLGSGELKTGGFRRQSILADAFEALVGALYLDAGIAEVRRIVLPLFDGVLRELPDPGDLKDAKTRLQEYLQGRGLALPLYHLDDVRGEPHSQVFRVRCESAQAGMVSEGSGSSRRRAEQQAAERMLAQLVTAEAPR